VFDSGVGGLTVLRALREALPDRDFVYLGDTARLPYGTKSQETVARYSLQCAAALVRRGIGRLVVACNTASASALVALRERYPELPVTGVIEPGAQAAVAASVSQHIAVVGTEGTIRGGAYGAAIERCNPMARVTARACSMFVALAEEGWTEGPIAEGVAREYLEPIFAAADAPDTLVLGCTHFPLLTTAIRRALPPGVRIVDSAATTARAVSAEAGGGVYGV
jgi:glutamate racemase